MGIWYLIVSYGLLPLISSAVIIGIVKYRVLNKAQMLIVMYCAISLVSELLSHYLIRSKIPNLVVVNIFIIIEFYLLTYFYKLLFQDKKIQVFHLLIWISGFAFILYESLTKHITSQYYSAFSLFANLIIVLYAVFFFRRIIIEQPVDIITDYYLFWFNSACFIYFSCTSIIFCLQNLPGSFMNTHQIMIFTHSLFNYIFYLLFIIGLCKTVQK
ncbi:MAG: hypothetical protein QM534_08340 [Sediminibacterium sp.]|nr:hypothetical protein [Sediminibacterium sp.]